MDAINHVKIHPFPSPSIRTALSKPRNLSYFPLKIRSRPKKGENRPGLRTDALIPGSQNRPAQRRHHPEGNQKKVSAAVSTFSSYDPLKTPSPRLAIRKKIRQKLTLRGGLVFLYDHPPLAGWVIFRSRGSLHLRSTAATTIPLIL